MSSSKTMSDSDLDFIKTYLAKSVPLGLEGRKLTVDKKTFESFLSDFLASHPDFRRKRRGIVSPRQVKELRKYMKDQFNAVARKLPFDADELKNKGAAPKRTLLMAGPGKLTETGYSLKEKAHFFEEWFCIRHALVKAGAHVEVIKPSAEKGGAREVYTRDRYVMVGNIAYLPDPDILATPELDNTSSSDKRNYRAEIARVKTALHKRGVKTVTVGDAWFEGGNVVRHYSSRTIFVGMDGRVSKASAQNLLAAINRMQKEKWSLLCVPLTNRPAMYHLDTGMSEELPHGEVLLSARVTDPDTYQKICRIVGPENVIPLSGNDEKKLATNMIDVGDTIIMSGNCKALKRKLAKRGYKVVQPKDYGQKDFEFGLGGVHCMTNDVRQPRRPRPPSPRGP